MSARDLFVEDYAVRQVLGSIESTLTSLERRLRWPGSVRFASAGSASLTEDVQATLVSLVVDPGAWWVLGGTEIEQFSLGGDFGLAVDIVGVESAGIEVTGASEPIVGDLDSMTAVGYGRLSAQTTIQLKVLWAVAGAPPTPTASALSSYLIAVPV